MKKILFISLMASALLMADTPKADANTFKYENETLRIRISKNSVNRIVLPAAITGKIFSQEKNLNIQSNGHEAYVKVIPSKKTETIDNKVTETEIVYADKEAEVFFLTENKTYAIVFVPDKIDTRTVYITDNTVKKEDIEKVEKASNEYTKNIKNIFKLAIANKLSNSFTEIVQNARHDDFLFLSQFDGTNYQVHKFFVFNKSDKTIEKINQIVKNKIVATAVFEQNYFILCEQNK
ncbi:type-F conjugative transfer system secretin TraK [Sulfurimonas sp.]|uniref:TraK domain-containing protein n=1 Tax=Sulfurimonas sp. TaxID=2022749 RepID=UPI00262DE163|nr:type-F conjugative transfer system secretin TraK [Sulfurimonas sp.]MDD3450927.1 type-F conjugative transfer system secretin TraK [Sulfurimonas sp.]